MPGLDFSSHALSADDMNSVASVQQEEQVPSVTVAQRELREALHAHAWNSLGLFVSLLLWGGLYYSREEFKKSNRYGYAVENIIEALIADAITFPFFAKAFASEDLTFSVTVWAAFKDFLAYFPLDCAYPAVEDFVVAYSRSNSTAIDFKPFDDPSFNAKEIGSAAGLYIGGYGLFYYGMNKLLRSPASLPVSFVLGLQYFSCYWSDALFDNIDPPDGLPYLLASSAMLTALSYTIDSTPDWWRYCKSRRYAGLLTQAEELAEIEHEEPQVLEEDKEAALMPSQLSVPLLSKEEQANVDPEEAQNARRHRGCGVTLSSYLCFWRRGEVSPIVHSVVPSYPLPSP